MTLTKKIFKTLLTLAFILSFSTAHAAEDAVTPPDMAWPHEGIFGTYDKNAVQRGYQIYRESCSACHSMKYMSYRNLAEIGFTEAEIKTIAAEYMVQDGPNDDGEMFERAAKPADRFNSPYPNDKAARYANNGALPPDLSLIIKAREHGEDYVYGILTGYEDAPHGEQLADGQYWNKYMLGHKIAMPPPLSNGQITYSDGKSASLEQAAADVTQYLAWASEPNLDARKKMGLKVMLFLMMLTALLYLSKKKIWRDVKK